MPETIKFKPEVLFSVNQLARIMADKKSSEVQKVEAVNILNDRQEKGWECLQKFFSSKNKFWELAKYQLYREGKAKVYGTGVHKRFYVKDTSLIFDKMVEIRTRFAKYEKGKTKINDPLLEEFNAWKR